MGKDEPRPKHLKGHKSTENVMVSCEFCMDGKHNRCTGFSTRGLVKCHCANYYHKED